jgi:restriction endonuclease Mrr
VPFNRWQFQCRNADLVDMGEIATTIGRSVSYRPNVVLSVATGHFTPRARNYASRAMQLTSFQLVLVDGDDLRALAEDEGMIGSILERETERARIAKYPQLGR